VTLLHPEVRIPTWVAVAVVAAAYVFRAVFVRGADFRPDLPVDLIVAAMLTLLLALRAWLRRSGWDRRDDGGPRDTPDAEDGAR
jgi:uncharacterized membrane protein